MGLSLMRRLLTQVLATLDTRGNDTVAVNQSSMARSQANLSAAQSVSGGSFFGGRVAIGGGFPGGGSNSGAGGTAA
jgi:hypothetical protein